MWVGEVVREYGNVEKERDSETMDERRMKGV